MIICWWLWKYVFTNKMYKPLCLLHRDTYSALSLYTFVTNTGWSVSTSTFRRIFRYITGIGSIRAVVVEQTGTFGLLLNILTDPSGLAWCVAITFTQWRIICSITFIGRISAMTSFEARKTRTQASCYRIVSQANWAGRTCITITTFANWWTCRSITRIGIL